jgi:hypothetical protein
MSLILASAQESKVTIDGEEVVGLQSIDFKITRTQADISAIGWLERIGVDSGQVIVKGSITVHSLNTHLDELLYQPVPTPFSMVVTLKKGDEQIKQITFDECYLDDKSFGMEATGVGLTTYNFTATRAREE